MSGYRLPNPARGAPLRFSFDGRPFVGHQGETLAAAEHLSLARFERGRPLFETAGASNRS